MKKRIFLSSPTINGSEMNYIKEAFDSNWIAPLGKNVDLLESEITEYLGGGYGVALSSGTAALHLAIKLAGVTEGDIVLCSSLTFAASANPISYEKGIPVFIDSEKDTWNMDPVALEKALLKYPNAKAVVLVHLYGTPSKMDEIQRICSKYNVTLIEDSAESFGAKYNGKYTGTFGDFAILSFNGNKIITTSGGGMLISSNQEAMKRARYLATQARTPVRHYQHTEIGYNYRMSNISAGIGRGQLNTLNEFIKKKKLIYHLYKILLSDIKELQMNPYDEQNSEPNYWLSCIFINNSTTVEPIDIILTLEDKNIECRPIWKPMHLQPVFANQDFIKVTSGISIAEEIFNQGVCLPSDIKNTANDMLEIINTIRTIFNKDLISESELNDILELIGWSDSYVV
jgi:dTDP-4-amino-4,6-dideoxygalactose transaminase